MTQDAISVAKTSPLVSELYGRLLTGSALLQLAQSPIDRVQCSLDHSGTAGTLLADVWPGPCVRGRVEHAQSTQAPLYGGDGNIHVSRQPARGGELYQSVSPMHASSIAGALQHFTMESEQVITFISLATVVDDDGQVTMSGGLFVQALPGMTDEDLSKIKGCLAQAEFEDLVVAGDHPFDASAAIFNDVDWIETGTDPILYRCRCSKQAAVGAVRTLSSDELAAVRAGATETVTCEFCGTDYIVSAVDLDAS